MRRKRYEPSKRRRRTRGVSKKVRFKILSKSSLSPRMIRKLDIGEIEKLVGISPKEPRIYGFEILGYQQRYRFVSQEKLKEREEKLLKAIDKLKA